VEIPEDFAKWYRSKYNIEPYATYPEMKKLLDLWEHLYGTNTSGNSNREASTSGVNEKFFYWPD